MSDLIDVAIKRLQLAEKMSMKHYKQPLMITYSGGKDSDVLVDLAIKSGIKCEIVNSHTSADAPETVRHIRAKFAALEKQGYDCKIVYPTYEGKRISMWTLIPKKLMPPTRLARYCCAVLKETSGKERMIATGVRWAESTRRKNTRGIYENLTDNIKKRLILINDNDDTRQLFENCQLKSTHSVNPIIDWEDRDIWDYLKAEKIKTNPLYQCGFNRVGCIGCPMASKGRYKQFAMYPKYKQMYIHAFDRMLDELKVRGLNLQKNWRNGIDVFHWWMQDGVLQDQIGFFDERTDDNG